jgi:hypothetical protein
MIYVLIFITILIIPNLVIFSLGNGYDGVKEGLMINQMLGNMGEASTKCMHQQLSFELNFHPHCIKGQILELIHVGLIP